MVGSRAEGIARGLDTSAKLQNGKLDWVGVGTQKIGKFLLRCARKPLYPYLNLSLIHYSNRALSRSYSFSIFSQKKLIPFSFSFFISQEQSKSERVSPLR